MTNEERDALIEQYRAGPGEVAAALADVGPEALDRPTGEGEWTVRVIVHHLADSEMISATRLRRLLAVDGPLIQGYDEPDYARRFHYAERPVEPAIEMLRAARSTTVQILERLGDADWRRGGTHEEGGEYGVEPWLRIYAAHAHEHADQIRRAAR
jgi:hypothetical protein